MRRLKNNTQKSSIRSYFCNHLTCVVLSAAFFCRPRRVRARASSQTNRREYKRQRSFYVISAGIHVHRSVSSCSNKTEATGRKSSASIDDVDFRRCWWRHDSKTTIMAYISTSEKCRDSFKQIRTKHHNGAAPHIDNKSTVSIFLHWARLVTQGDDLDATRNVRLIAKQFT